MKVLIVLVLLSFLFNTFARASERSVTTKSGEPPPPPPPWSKTLIR